MLLPKKYSSFEKKLDIFITQGKSTLILFFVLLYILFELTFSLGNFLGGIIDTGGNFLFEILGIENTFFSAIWGGVLGVLLYIPNIIILYFFLYLLEDSGILPRISYVFDKKLSHIGVSRKGFLSLFLGFGCTVPAILSTQEIASKKEKILTIMMLPFISCSAKLPVFILLISAFIPNQFQSLVLIGLYVFGIIIGILSSLFFTIFFKKEQKKTFSIQLPHYQVPHIKAILSKIYKLLSNFLKKVFLFILPFSILLTLAFSYPKGADIQNSYGTKIGNSLQYIFEPLGFNNHMSVSILAGFAGKEVIVSTLDSLYSIEKNSNSPDLGNKFSHDDSVSFAAVISFLIFILLYTSCLGAVITARGEIGNIWGLLFLLYPILIAWGISFLFYRIFLLI